MPVFDQGYQHWNGPLAGHAWRWVAIARHGVRVQMQNRLLRLLVLLAWLPALALVVAVTLWGLVEQKSEGVLGIVKGLPFIPADFLVDPRAYRSTVWTIAYSLFFKVQVFNLMFLAAVAGPGLISRDLRFNALPLYLSRPMTRFDYFLGKLGVIGALVAWVSVGPAVFAYVVGVGFSLDLGVVRDTWPVLLGGVAFGAVVTVSVGTLVLAVSSLTRRSIYVFVAFAGFWLVSWSAGGILAGLHQQSLRREGMDAEMTRWLRENPPPPGTRMSGKFPQTQFKDGKVRLAGVDPGHEKEAERWHQAWGRASQEAWTRAQEGQGTAARDDWRPLCSYTANLNRMADLLLDTDAAWVAVGKAWERSRKAAGAVFGARPGSGPLGNAPAYERRLADQMVMQFPWVWSAGVLAGLVGLSAWTLSRRVKSLDRLK
jgi:ABC-type transport system involved in multi-copper enzyme maturation permease subunit